MNIEQIRTAAESQSSHLSGPSCVKISIAASAADAVAAGVYSLFQNAVAQGMIPASVIRTGSFGFYDLEPIVTVERPESFAVLCNNVTPDRVPDLIDVLSKGVPGKSKALCCFGDKKANGIPHITELPLFCLQNRIALRNCGWIDPDDIHHYICHGRGYSGLSCALKVNQAELAGVLISSGLNGSRSPGCSTAEKWLKFRETEAGDKCLICNAMDPDPRSFTSRLLLESDPHSILEGMLISAYAVGASHCSLLVEDKAEAVGKLRNALDQMRTYNLLGLNILDSMFCVEIDIMEAASSWMSGHRIELFRCIDEKQIQPHILPADFPASKLAEKPALIVNPEMMASLSGVLRDGVKDIKGTKVVTLSGCVVHPCTVEVLPETTIQSIIEWFGGGVLDGKTIKAVQLGGPTGPYLAPKDLDLPIGGSLSEESGACIDSGAIEVMDANSRIVETTKDAMAYIQAQSCGKCVFCREGCLQMLTILEDISENKSRPQDVDLLVELGEEMRMACLCAFGRMAPNPVLSSIRLFRNEYET